MPVSRFVVQCGLVPALFAACASVPRAAEEPSEEEPALLIAHAIHEVGGEFPGVEVSASRFVLSTRGRATASAPDSATARRALDAGFAVADSVGLLLDGLNPASEIAAVNRAAGVKPVRVSPWTSMAVAAALEWAERTDGAFDPTVGPLVNLWGFGPSSEPRVPDAAAIAAARRRVGWSRVELDSEAGTVFLPDSGMQLDLRALVKGFALDRMREAMIEAGATSGIIDFSGDLVFFGPGPQSTKGLWPIELRNPFDPDRGFAVFEVPSGSAATSSSLKRQVTLAGRRYGHLIDPRTGRPIDVGVVSVSVFSQQALISDILATSLFVLGPSDGPKMVERWPDAEAVFVTDTPPRSTSAVVVTTGLESHRQWLEPPYRPAAPED